MKHRILADEGSTKLHLLVLESGEEVTEKLLNYSRSQNLGATHFTAIGAFEKLVIGYFDYNTKKYREIPIDEQVEVLSLIGDIVDENKQPKLHAHVVVGKSDGTAHGGHLISARVRPTLELLLSSTLPHLSRKYDPNSGLALIEP